jgi:hypothetical protein
MQEPAVQRRFRNIEKAVCGRRGALPLLSAVLFVLNAFIVSKLFSTEYLSGMGSVEGVFISYTRYARDHWPDLGWCRFWFAGMPFQNAYPPALHLTAAGVSYFGHISAALAFHIVVAFAYAVGPVAVFWLAARLTGTVGWSFCASLLYSLTSPSALLVGDIRHDLGSLFWAQRLHTPVTYGDSPHVVSLSLIPLAILALDMALTKRRAGYYVLASVAMAAVPMTNWPGAIVLFLATVAYALTLVGQNGRRTWMRIVAIGVLGYAMAVPWMPPSTVIRTQANVQDSAPANRFGPQHVMYVAVAIAATWAALRLLRIARVPPYLAFFFLFFLFTAAITLGWYWFGVTLLAEPNRFHLAMEMGLVLGLTFAVRLGLENRPGLKRPLAACLVALCSFQFVEYNRYARRLIRPIDVTGTSEYRTAKWFADHRWQGRVMVPGSTTFWLNAFTDTPQLTGCCGQSVLTHNIPYASYGINTDLTAENRAFENSLLWFKALGIRAVVVSGAKSTEVYKPFHHPRKFEGRLPVLWRNGDDVIYEVPWRCYSIAHAVAPGALVQRAPMHGVDTAPLASYVAAIERPDAPCLQVQWPNNETMVVSGTLEKGDVVSVQENAHPGWHATVNGSARPVMADKIGLLAVAPECSGDCSIRLRYDGGNEMTAAHWVSRCAIGGSLAWIALGLLLGPISRLSARSRGAATPPREGAWPGAD